MKKSAQTFFLALLITLSGVAEAACQPAASIQEGGKKQLEQAPQSPLPPPTGFVNDYSNVLDEITKSRLEATLNQLRERSAIEFAVALVDSTEGRPINEYSLAVARGWGIGPKDSTEGGGILLLAAIKDRVWRIEVNPSLQKDLPDDTVLQLGRVMNEPFRRQEYGEGVTSCVNAIIGRLIERRGFVMGEGNR